MQSISFIPLKDSEKIFDYCYEKLPFVPPWQPIKSSDLEKVQKKRKGLLNKLFS